MQEIRNDKELAVSYKTFVQKLPDECRLGYAEGREEGWEEALKEIVVTLLDTAVSTFRRKQVKTAFGSVGGGECHFVLERVIQGFTLARRGVFLFGHRLCRRWCNS